MNLIKRSFTLEGHQTSIALEKEFWDVLFNCAQKNEISMPALISQVDLIRGTRPLASALRVYALNEK